MGHVRIQHDSRAGPKPMAGSASFDTQFAPKTVDYDLTWGPVLRQATSGLECEQEEPKRSPMDQPCLPVTALGRVRFGLQNPGEIRQIERYNRAHQPRARMRPEPFI